MSGVSEPVGNQDTGHRIVPSTTPADQSSGKLSLDEEAQMMSDFLRLLPTGGGIRTSRWATDEDRKIGFAELEAKKTAGKVKTHAVFKKDIERYKEENPVYFKPPQGSVSSGKVSDSPQSTVASSPRSLSANALNFTPRKTSTPISNEGKHWMALRDDDLLFGPSKPTVVVAIASPPAATRNQAGTFGESCPVVPLLPAKIAEIGRLPPCIPTHKDREEAKEAMQPTKLGVKNKSCMSVEPGFVSSHPIKHVGQDATPSKTVQSHTRATPVTRSEYVPPHLRKSVPQIITAVKTSELPAQRTYKEQVQTTTQSSSSDYVPPHLRKPVTQVIAPVKTAEHNSQQPSQDRVQSTSPEIGSNYVPPHLRKRVAQSVTPTISAKAISQGAKPAIEETPLSSANSSCHAISFQTPVPLIRSVKGSIPAISDNMEKSTKPKIGHLELSESMDDFRNFKSVDKFDSCKYGRPESRRPSDSALVSFNCHKTTSTGQKMIRSKPNGTISSSGIDSKIMAPTKVKPYLIEELLQIGDSPGPKKPQHIHAAIMHEISSAAQDNKGTNTVPLTKDTLVLKTGAAPPKSGNSLGNTSDQDIELQFSDGDRLPDDETGPDCRNELAFEGIGLVDWDGKWAPVPASWEDERNGFNNTFMPTYIHTWALKTPPFESVNITAEKFLSGAASVNTGHGTFMEAPSQQHTLPDLKNSENSRRQTMQTAELSCQKMQRQRLKEERIKTQWKISAQAQIDRIFQMPTYNTNTPLIPVYLRPARVIDIPGITSIYNHYTQNSIVTEDQDPVSDDQMLEFFKNLRKEYLPFIVAIKGAAPQKGRKIDNEFVVGYSCLIGNFGINNVATRGLRRFTSKIQFFVEPNHLRKGIGRALLDRLLTTSTSTHNPKEGYDWVVTENEAEEYNNLGFTGGERRYHQLMIELPVEVKDDKTLPWFEEWLRRKFWFKQVALFDYVGRTKAGGENTRWLDLAVFQMEASITQCYNVNH